MGHVVQIIGALLVAGFPAVLVLGALSLIGIGAAITIGVISLLCGILLIAAGAM